MKHPADITLIRSAPPAAYFRTSLGPPQFPDKSVPIEWEWPPGIIKAALAHWTLGPGTSPLRILSLRDNGW